MFCVLVKQWFYITFQKKMANQHHRMERNQTNAVCQSKCLSCGAQIYVQRRFCLILVHSSVR